MTMLEIDLVTCLSSRGPVAWGLSEPQVRTLTFTTLTFTTLTFTTLTFTTLTFTTLTFTTLTFTTLTFTTIVIADLSLILTNRSRSETILTTPGPGTGRLWWSFCRR